MQSLLAIEVTHGRTRTGPPGGPRSLDLDLLLYNVDRLQSAHVTVPHPRLHERAFVLYPLLEIAPELFIPGVGSVAELARATREQSITRMDECEDA